MSPTADSLGSPGSASESSARAADPLDRERLSFLIGPTASGKSTLALRVAELAEAEILSMDSMLVYAGMDVGTAKPSREDRERVPHHMIDLVRPDETYNAQRFVSDARRALESVRGRGKRALFVGGTALYLKTLTHGLFEGPAVDPDLRASLKARAEREGAELLHAALARVDAASAERIHPRDEKRVVRALEVFEQTGRTLSSWQDEWARGPKRDSIICGLSATATELDRRIPARTRSMLDAGWREEAVAIRDGAGFSETSSQALGYAEVLAWAMGELDRAACEERINLRTRQFARRQRTWFRSFQDVTWLEAPRPEDLEARAEQVARILLPDRSGEGCPSGQNPKG